MSEQEKALLDELGCEDPQFPSTTRAIKTQFMALRTLADGERRPPTPEEQGQANELLRRLIERRRAALARLDNCPGPDAAASAVSSPPLN